MDIINRIDFLIEAIKRWHVTYMSKYAGQQEVDLVFQSVDLEDIFIHFKNNYGPGTKILKVQDPSGKVVWKKGDKSPIDYMKEDVVQMDALDRNKIKGLSNVLSKDKAKWQKAFDKEMTSLMKHGKHNPNLFSLNSDMDGFATESAEEVLKQMGLKFDNKKYQSQAVMMVRDAFYGDED